MLTPILTQPDFKSDAYPVSSEPAAPSAPPTILVVDDEASGRDLIIRILNRAGYRVRSAIDGREAFRHIDQGGIDLIITDLFMPQMDGLELVMHLREQSRAIPVIAISGALTGQGEDILRTVRMLGAAVTLPKPFTAHELIAAVNQFVSAPLRKSSGENGS